MASATKSQPVYPEVASSVTIPDLLEFHVKHNPNLPFFVYASEESDEIREISFRQYARACHRAAHILRPNRRTGLVQGGDVVAVIANVDTLVYHAISVGIMVAGLVPFPISPRNTPAAVINLLKKTSCHRLVTTSTTLSTLLDGVHAELGTGYRLDIAEAPGVYELYPHLGVGIPEDAFEPYPNASARANMQDVAMFLHSSGSTGFPKAIPETHEIFTHWAAFPIVSQIRASSVPLRIAGMHLPPFHTMGVYAQLVSPLYTCTPMALFPPRVFKVGDMPVNPTPHNTLESVAKTRCNAIITMPTFLAIWAQDEKSIEVLKSMVFVCYSGGAPSKKLGDRLCSHGVPIAPLYGGTEFGAPTYMYKREEDRDDWEYMEFDAARANIRWVPQGDGTFECQLLTTPTHTLAVENLPDVKGYATSDLWERHPTKPHLWRIVGRADDVIIHSSGEKTVPTPFEDAVMSSPLVMGVIMFGQKHDQPGALIEPIPEYAVDVRNEEEVTKLRNLLWPVVDEANKSVPTFSRIFKELILITSKDKPLPRAAKGTVMRKAALNVYEAEIKEIYDNVEDATRGENVPPPASWTSVDDVRAWLQTQTREMNNNKDFLPGADLFEQGFDSLTSTILRRRIIGALRTTHTPQAIKAINFVTQNIVYTYPTIDSLASFFADVASNGKSAAASAAGSVERVVKGIEDMIEKYSADLESTTRAQKQVPKDGEVVLLTGSTGNLGAQLLDILLRKRDVKKVYIVNRPSKGSGASVKERQEERFRDKGLDTGLLDGGKVVFVETDLAAPKLGLEDGLYEELRDSVTAIIHNAWLLNFNLSLTAFEPNVRGTRNLIDLAIEGGSKARFLFTSSVASAQGWPMVGKGMFPEEVQQDSRVAVGNGYGEGKYVSERVLAKSGLDATSFRIGQICGGQPNGAWATTDWVPIMIKSSLKLGGLPTGPGGISWLPMDAVANTIVDVVVTRGPVPMAVNLVHPRIVTWGETMKAIRDALGVPELKLLPIREWFQHLEVAAKKGADVGEVPAIKLLEFYRAIADAEPTSEEMGVSVQFSSEKAQAVSQTMKNVPLLNASDIQRWVSYWKGVHFL